MGDFDMVGFLSAGKENAAVVIFLVLVLTYIAGLFGARGRAQMAVGMGLGFILGGTFQAAAVGWPVDFAGWFWLVIYALVMAVLPVTVYELWKDVSVKKAAAQAAARIGESLAPGPLGRD